MTLLIIYVCIAVPGGRDWGVGRCQTGGKHREAPASGMIFLVKKEQGKRLQVEAEPSSGLPSSRLLFPQCSQALPHIFPSSANIYV